MEILTFARFIPWDEDIISEIAVRCLSEINSKDLSPLDPEKIIKLYSPDTIRESSQDPESPIFVAKKGPNIVGTVTISENRIRSFFVHPDFHYQWIGSFLLENAETYIQEKGYDFAFLFSSVYALEFYKKYGYQEWWENIDPKIGPMMELRKYF